MDVVFPSSREEKCPRTDCGSLEVERLRAGAEFARLSVESPVHTLWLCVMCQRPFKLVREPGTAPAPERGRRGPIVPLER